MALRTSSVGCLESIRGVAMPAVDDFTNGNGLYCQKRGNLESRTSKSSPIRRGFLARHVYLARARGLQNGTPSLPEMPGGVFRQVLLQC